MTKGFTFKGIHSSAFGVTYIPDESASFEDKADFEVYDEDINWRSGGVYYGYKVKAREFELDCYYEDITRRTYEEMRQWLDVKQTGKLIFDDTPFKYYDVRLTKKLTGKQYWHRDEYYVERLSGTFTITFTAYKPFAKMLYKYYEDADVDGASKYCGIISKAKMPAEPTVSDRTFNIYNCGTETAPTIIRIGGTVDSDGLTITNAATEQTCRLTALPASPAYLELDSEKGSVTLIDPDSGTKEIMFEYHDYGFLDLAPSGVMFDNFYVNCTKGSNTVTATNRELDSSYVGKYVFLDKSWLRILSVSGKTMTLSGTSEKTRVAQISPVTMNTMTLTGNMTLDKLEIDYTPLVQ